jgi:hypothetical protein
VANGGYDATRLINALKARGINPVIPPSRNRNTQPRYDKRLYQQRYLVEVFFHNKLDVLVTRALYPMSVSTRTSQVRGQQSSFRGFSSPQGDSRYARVYREARQTSPACLSQEEHRAF